jgi:ABC-2 type transport system permease protein
MRYVRLFGVFLSTSVLSELQYRVNFWVQALQTVIGFATTAAGLAIIFSNTNALGGWSPAQMVGLLGIYYLMSSLLGVLLQPCMQRLMEDVRQGTLDYSLTKPIDSQFLVSIRQVQIWKVTDGLLGVALAIGSVVAMGASVGVGQALGFLVTLVAGAVIIYSFMMLLATLTFWIIRVDNILVIFNSLYQAGKYPVGIYPPWLRVILTFLVPVTFATTVPAEALAARLTLASLAGAVGLALALFIVARLFWRYGLRSYTGASA